MPSWWEQEEQAYERPWALLRADLRLLASLSWCVSHLGLDHSSYSYTQFPTRSHTVAAQGGINAALGKYVSKERGPGHY